MKIIGKIRIYLIVLSIIPGISFGASPTHLKTSAGDFTFEVSGMLREEMVAGKNIALLNDNNIGNKIWYMRSTLDLNLGVNYGEQSYGRSVAEAYVNIRNRAIWGNPESIATTTNTALKITDAITGDHTHKIPVHILWLRELWLKFGLTEAMNLSFENKHYFQLGLFSFVLGRGIALGDAFAVGPTLLGFYNNSFVDQFAPGALLHGDLLAERLSYDLYAGILSNKGTGLSETGAAILGQEYGRRKTPQRGSGKITFIVATRLNWDIYHGGKEGKLHIEPYALYNRDPEQTIEFIADASSNLGTVGLASEYTFKHFEMGFDTAFNLGQQNVKGWDRNKIDLTNRNGQVVIVNSEVVDQNKNQIPYVKKNGAQPIIDFSAQDESQNGHVIGEMPAGVGYLSGPVTLTNSAKRFRNPYVNHYKGWMFVTDAAYWVIDKELRFAGMAGITTGDENPNNETIDGTYTGFIPLQEGYSGKRVKSAFLLGGAGKLRRPLSAPESNQAVSDFASTVDGFTNLVFFGTSAHWKPAFAKKEFILHPNILAYWQEKPSKRFDAKTGTQLNENASTYLGIELNIFSHLMLFQSLKLYFVGSVFLPGAHYRQVRGLPLSKADQALLDELDETGFDDDRIPNLGADPAYTLNLGLEFKF